MKFRTIVYMSFTLFLLQLAIAGVANGQGYGQVKTDKAKPFADRSLSAIFNVKVQAELELVGSQKVELKSVLEELKKQQSVLGEELKKFAEDASPEMLEARQKEVVAQFEEIKNQTRSAIHEVLLPHQHERLSQVTAQLMLRESAKKNAAGVLAPEMLEYLEINKAQATRLKNKAQDIRDRLAKEIARLTKEAQDELMQELTPRQRKKYDSVVGDPVKGL